MDVLRESKFSVYRWDIILPTGLYSVYGSYYSIDSRTIVIWVDPVSVESVAVIPDHALVMRQDKVRELNFDDNN